MRSANGPLFDDPLPRLSSITFKQLLICELGIVLSALLLHRVASSTFNGGDISSLLRPILVFLDDEACASPFMTFPVFNSARQSGVWTCVISVPLIRTALGGSEQS
jgi:hypothetical protein